MFINAHIKGVMSPSEFCKLGAGEVIYYEVLDAKDRDGYKRSQRFIASKATLNKIHINQSKMMAVSPLTLKVKLLMRVEIIDTPTMTGGTNG